VYWTKLAADTSVCDHVPRPEQLPALAAVSLLQSIERHLPPGFHITGQLGSGATSWVYLAQRSADGAGLAVKALNPGLARNDHVDRFRREMAILQALDHPHIVPVLHTGEADGALFFTMPYLEGGSLRDLLRSGGPFPVRDALMIARDLADALSHVHGRGMIHRDVKPENILFGNGQVYLVDFGFARAPSLTPEGAAAEDARLTIGTPGYISPEQLTGKRAEDWRSDFFSLACVLQETLTGRPPFAGESARETMRRRLTDPPEDIRAACPECPDDVIAIVRRNLAMSPNDRYATAGFLRMALEAAIARIDEHEHAA
jgi:serine/threonine-protein kinase